MNKTLQQITADLAAWKTTMQAVDQSEWSLRASVGLDPEAPLPLAIAHMQSAYTRAVSEQVGDEHDWLTWFWLENDMGAQEHAVKAGHGHKFKQVKTIEDLAQLVMDSHTPRIAEDR